MRNELDLKFYADEILDRELIRKVIPQGKKFAHHLRVSHEDELTSIHSDLLRKGFDTQ
jgi:hypothetical protein